MTETSELSFEWGHGNGWVIGIVLILGKWTVGNVYYDGTRNKDDPKKYVAISNLPGLKKVLDYFEDEEQAKQRVEKATKYWLSKLYEVPITFKRLSDEEIHVMAEDIFECDVGIDDTAFTFARAIENALIDKNK